MAELPEALDTALNGFYSVRGDFRSPADSRRGFQARVRALEKEHGSKKAAAAAVGVNANTWTRWTTKGRTPTPASVAKVAGAHFSLLRAAKVAKKGPPRTIDIQATVACTSVHPKSRTSNKYNQGGSNAAYRWFRADQLTGPQLRDVAGAWAAGKSPRDVADVLLDGIQRAYGSRFEFEGNSVNVEIN